MPRQFLLTETQLRYLLDQAKQTEITTEIFDFEDESTLDVFFVDKNTGEAVPKFSFHQGMPFADDMEEDDQLQEQQLEGIQQDNLSFFPDSKDDDNFPI